MNYNQNSGYGLAEHIRMHLNIPVLGKILVVCPSTDANYDRLVDLVKTDPDGNVRLFTTLDAAYTAATTNANDVILLQGTGTHSVAVGGLAITKSRIHFVGMDGGGRYLQQGAKVQSTAGTAAVYVIKNTGTRNTFRNIKFIPFDINFKYSSMPSELFRLILYTESKIIVSPDFNSDFSFLY